MQLKEGEAKLFETEQGKAKPFPPQKIGEAIIGSDVTYEDLSLRFLYWKDAEIVGRIKSKCKHATSSACSTLARMAATASSISGFTRNTEP